MQTGSDFTYNKIKCKNDRQAYLTSMVRAWGEERGTRRNDLCVMTKDNSGICEHKIN